MKARIVFHVHLKPGRQDDFIRAYGAIRNQVAEGVKGHILDQVCQNVDDPQWWLITSEWESLESFVTWPGGAKSIYFRDPDDNLAELITPEFWGIY